MCTPPQKGPFGDDKRRANGLVVCAGLGFRVSHPWFFKNNFASQEDRQQYTRGLCQIWLEARECFSIPTIYWQHTRIRGLNFLFLEIW